MENPKTVAEQLYFAAVGGADPAAAVAAHTDELRARYQKEGFHRLLVCGFGKAAILMAEALERALGDLIDSGFIITKYGHGPSANLEKIRLMEAGHPIPDANGVRGAEEVIRLTRSADARTLLVALISGGGSALCVAPAAGIALADKQRTTDLLLRAGADIGELNCVRKHLSCIKGGRLAELLYPATAVALLLSDVIGDRLDVIASGPTAPDRTTFADALAVLKNYRLLRAAPRSVVELLTRGKAGEIPETPKEGNPVFHSVTNIIIGSLPTALAAAEKAADRVGLKTEILSAQMAGEAREAGRWLAHKAIAVRATCKDQLPLCLLAGGETTVTVAGAGKGGRNTELALAFAMEIEGCGGITLLSAGTDGGDGPTDAAGALVDGSTIPLARNLGLDPATFLRDNDSYSFFEKSGGLFKTGPTGTNVMDIQIIILT
ncbi:MAG: glycerate kinase [Geobacter sp.]|nr:MAG: glycerate kinase [Geobacter sp.]